MGINLVKGHIDWFREVIEHNKENFNGEANLISLKTFADDLRVLSLIETAFDDKKTLGVCASIRATSADHFKKVTDKQRFYIATTLLEKYGSARAVVAAAFTMSEVEIFGPVPEIESESAGESEAELIAEGVSPLHPTLRIGYGVLADFVATVDEQQQGITFRATVAAVKSVQAARYDTKCQTLGIAHPVTSEMIIVTLQEKSVLQAPEVDCEWYQPRITDQDIASVAGKLRSEL